MRLEALRALQAAADAGHSGLARRWPALSDAIVANTQVLGCGGGRPHGSPQKRQHQRHQRSEGARRAAYHAPLSSSDAPDGRHNQDSVHSALAPGVIYGQEANEQCGLQALRLLAAVLAQLSRSVSPPQSDPPTAHNGTSSVASSAAAKRVDKARVANAVCANGRATAAAAAPWPAAGGGVSMPSADSPCDKGTAEHEPDNDALSATIGAWQDATMRILPDCVASPSAQVRAVGVAAIAGLTPGVHEQMPPETREQLWRWAIEAARDEAATVRAAAAKAAAAYAAIVVWPGVTAGGIFGLPRMQPAWPPCRCAHTMSRSHLAGWLKGNLIWSCYRCRTTRAGRNARASLLRRCFSVGEDCSCSRCCGAGGGSAGVQSRACGRIRRDRAVRHR